jgi:parallel beta-helix repeat protein
MSANPRAAGLAAATTLAALAALSTLALTATTASADDACTTAVSADTTLAADQPGCVLVVRAAGVSLDLGGHQVGKVDLTQVPAGGKVTVKHGTIDPSAVSAAHTGVEAAGANVKLTGLTIQNADTGISVTGGTALVVNDTVSHSSTGIAVAGAHDSTVAASTVTGGGTGILLSATTSVNVIGDVISANTFSGIRLSQVSGGTVAGNQVNGNGTGLDTAFGNNAGVTVVANQFDSNRVRGLSFTGTAGDVTVAYNLTSRNGTTTKPPREGIFVSVTTLTGHTTALTLTGNLATDNGGAGINATGATDGGHNTAHGNGGAAQCAGVAC